MMILLLMLSLSLCFFHGVELFQFIRWYDILPHVKSIFFLRKGIVHVIECGRVGWAVALVWVGPEFRHLLGGLVICTTGARHGFGGESPAIY